MAFPTVPSVFPGNAPTTVVRVLKAIKENIDLLTGKKGSGTHRAVIPGQITIGTPHELRINDATSIKGYEISGRTVADVTDTAQLATNVQDLINEERFTRDTLIALIKQLKGE